MMLMCLLNIVTLGKNAKNLEEWYLSAHAAFLASIANKNVIWRVRQQQQVKHKNEKPISRSKFDQVEALTKVCGGLRKIDWNLMHHIQALDSIVKHNTSNKPTNKK